jgi:hypothetical protein
VEVEVDVVVPADQAVAADRQTVTIDLEAVAESWLDDALAALDLADQTVDVGHEVVGDVGQVGGDDRAQEEAAEARCRVDREHHVPEGDAPRRHRRAGVPDLEFSEQHDAVDRSVDRSDVRPHDGPE